MSHIDFFQPFVVGGAAGMLASSIVHPIDLAKVRLQLHSTINPGTVRPSFGAMLSHMMKTEGLFSIYSGLSASLLRQSVYATTRFGFHRTFSNYFKTLNNNQPIPFYQKVISGMASGTIGVVLCTPIDRICQEEGLSKLYSGLIPSILRGMAVNVGMMAFYDEAKEIIQRRRSEDLSREASQSTQAVAAVVAGFTNTVIASPFDQIKSRLQYNSDKYKGVRDVVSVILRKEGVLAFWTGYWAYYLRTAPHNMIILISTDYIIRLYRRVLSVE